MRISFAKSESYKYATCFLSLTFIAIESLPLFLALLVSINSRLLSGGDLQLQTRGLQERAACLFVLLWLYSVKEKAEYMHIGRVSEG